MPIMPIMRDHENRFDYKRRKGLKPHLVRITGHYGEPWWGVVVSHVYTAHGTTARDVVVVPRPLSPRHPERIMCYDRYIKPACLTTEPDDVVHALLDKLVAVGTLTKGERRSLLAARRKALQPIVKPLKRTVTSCHASIGSRPGPPAISSRLGANTVAHDWRRKSGVWG